MIDEIKIDNFLNLVDLDNIRVHQPSSVFLVCGGSRDAAASPAPSLREAFLRVSARGSLSKHESLLAEDLTKMFNPGGYRDFLNFESDIAQISSLVLLFSESYGSAAELGAFAIIPSIAEKLFAVIDDKHYSDNSFIKFGPLLSLQNTHGDSSVCVLNRKDIGIENIKDLRNLNIEMFYKIISDSVEDRLTTISSHSSFDKKQNGHVIKLIVGIIQWYGALTLDELDICLMYFDLSRKREEIENFLVCAISFKWLAKDKRGTKTYYVASAAKMAVQFSFKDGATKIQRQRWQAEIREIWKEKDPVRFNCIVAAQEESTP